MAERAYTASVRAREWIKEGATVAEVSVGIDDGAKIFVNSAVSVVQILIIKPELNLINFVISDVVTEAAVSIAD